MGIYAIKFVSEITFLSISIKHNDVTDYNISKTSRKFYHKANQVMNNFKYLYRNIKSQLLSSYCLGAYGSQLWPFYYGIFLCRMETDHYKIMGFAQYNTL